MLIHGNEAGWEALPEATREQAYGAYAVYGEALKQAGALRGSGCLRPVADSTTVGIRGDQTQVLDGAYLDTKEQIEDFYLIEAADFDAPIDWASRRLGASHAVMEVRPVW